MSTTQELIGRALDHVNREIMHPEVRDTLRQAADRLASLSAEVDAVKAREAKLREAMKSALKRLEKGAPGWGVAKDELRAALGGAG